MEKKTHRSVPQMNQKIKPLTIRFSHRYPKLHGQKTAKLLAVHPMESVQLHSDLIEYDTVKEDGTHYGLPTGVVIHLTFLGDKMIPFSTIRRHTDDKLEYYKTNIDRHFDIAHG